MKLSIITINFNNCVGLRKTLKSVMSQTCKDFEWIVIDGGSSDGSRELIEMHQEIIAYWCSEPDKGIYHAMNKGIAKAHGEYLQFLNSGDILADVDVIEKTLPFLQDKDIYVGNMYLSSYIGKQIVNPVSLETQNVLHTLAFGTIMHQPSFINKLLFERFGTYSENMHIISDWWFFFKTVVLYDASVIYIPVVICVFDDTGISSTRPDLMWEEQYGIWERHVPLGQLFRFYQDNYDIISSLKNSRIIFFIFRMYFYFYRILKKRKR